MSYNTLGVFAPPPATIDADDPDVALEDDEAGVADGEIASPEPYGEPDAGHGLGHFGEPPYPGTGVGDAVGGGEPLGDGGATDPAVARGRAHVESLRDGGQLSPERAEAVLADPTWLGQTGTLLGDGTDPAGTRAAEVLLGVGGGAADEHLSGLARAGMLEAGTFTVLANDIDFLQSIDALLQPGPDGLPSDPGAANLLVDRALGNLNAGRAPNADEGEVFMSRDGLPFVVAPPTETAPATPLFIGQDGQPLPPELQMRLSDAVASGEPMDPTLLRAAGALTGQVALSPAEQFAVVSYARGGTDADIFVSQINDPAFLESPEVARAAESLFGTNPAHTKADDFVNKLFIDGHIDQATYIEHVNDAAFLADIDAQIGTGSVTYTTGNFGQVDEMLGMSEQQIRDTLAPGFDIDQGPPSPEQIIALYEAGGRGDHQFVELAVNYVQFHNPELELQFGHRTQEEANTGGPLEFFWTRDGEPIEDPFLDSLSSELHGNGDSDVAEHFHRMRKPYADGEHEGQIAPISTPVRLKFEGVSHDADDETTDASRHTVGLVFPGVDIDDVIGTNGAVASSGEAINVNERGHGVDAAGNMTTTFGIDVDDHFSGAQYVGGIDGKARQALEVIDPDLFGTQITQVDGVDGFEVTNETRFDNTVVRANDADGLTVGLQDNAGHYVLELSNSDDVTMNEGAGQGTLFVPPDGRSVIDGYAAAGAGEPDAPGTAGDGDGTASVNGLTFNGGAHSSVSNSRLLFAGDVSDVQINGDGGSQEVHVHGDFSGGQVHGGGGEDTFVAHGGSTVTDTDIAGDDGNDQIVQLEGATFDGVDLQGGRGGDHLSFAGHNVDVTMDPGENDEVPDQISLHDTVSGDLFGEDPDGSSYETKNKDFDDHDIIKLYGDWTESEDGYVLTGADGGVQANFEIGGNADHFEEVGLYDPETGEEIEQLKYLEPEIITSNEWMNWTSQIMMAVGTFVPVVGAVGVGLNVAYKLDNGMDSFTDIASSGLGLIPGGSTGTLVKAGMSFGLNAANGNWEGALAGAIPFIPGDVGHYIAGAYSGYQGIDAALDGDIAGASAHFGGSFARVGQGLGSQDLVDVGRITYSTGGVIGGVQEGDPLQIAQSGFGIGQGVNGLLDDGGSQTGTPTYSDPGNDSLEVYEADDDGPYFDGYGRDGASVIVPEEPLEFS